jgi:UDP-N-acetylmuramyl pentapeptide phosphotransferase/UDP-N-acetylglucosamine-1-phosphate transferase
VRSYLLTFVLAVVFGLALTPLAIVVGRRLGLLDTTADPATPRSGGLAVIAATFLAILVLGTTFLPARALLLDGLGRMAPVLWAALGLVVLGVADDRRRLMARPKLTAEIALAVALFLWGGVRATTL